MSELTEPGIYIDSLTKKPEDDEYFDLLANT
jgi:hypothetical protein